jgi:hypothetical protein
MEILEGYKVPEFIREKQLESLEKMRPQLEKHYETRTIQQSGPSLNDR